MVRLCQDTEVPVCCLDHFQEFIPVTHMSATCYQYLSLRCERAKHKCAWSYLVWTFLRHPKPRTYWEEVPCDCRCSKASKHIIRAAEMSEVGDGHSLTSALTPHQNLAALGLGSWCVTGVTCSHFRYPRDQNQKVTTDVLTYISFYIISIEIWHFKP